MIKYKDLEVNMDFDLAVFGKWMLVSVVLFIFASIVLNSLFDPPVECYETLSYASDAGVTIHKIIEDRDWGSNSTVFRTIDVDELKEMMSYYNMCEGMK